MMKNFVKALDIESAAFQFLKKKFPGISDSKLKEGIFIGPQIRQVICDDTFDGLLKTVEKRAWLAFKDVCTNLLGNNKPDDYETKVNVLLDAYESMACNMSLKIHLLHSHLDYFLGNNGAVSEEHEERFHQDVATIERRFKGENM